MAAGPDGSGVVIRKPDPNAPRETYQEREKRVRAAHVQRVQEHEARQAEFEQQQQKQDARPIEDKMERRGHRSKAARPRERREDLEALSDQALMALAETRGIVVTNPDGHEPTRDDYVRELAR